MFPFISKDKDPDATLAFVREHRDDNPRMLALRANNNPLVDVAFALNQITGIQIARHKLPMWADCDGVVFPPHLSIEQCSSQTTAQYKAPLVVGDTMADLTGGFGVDFTFMSRSVRKAVFVERNLLLCEIARHNFPLLGIGNATVLCDNAENYLTGMEPVGTIFLDPARRDSHGRKMVAVGDCEPDVVSLMPLLRQRAQRVILKLSPMLDVTALIRDLPGISQIHIVSTANECKELLAVIDAEGDAPHSPQVSCVNDGQTFSFQWGEDFPSPPVWNEDSEAPLYLFEPNASVMKAGCFAAIANFFGVSPISAQSHLFVSKSPVPDFPGRAFMVKRVCSMNKKELKAGLAGITHANITTRNFPIGAEALRHKLRLKDGGDTFIFATTTATGRHLLLVTEKLR